MTSSISPESPSRLQEGPPRREAPPVDPTTSLLITPDELRYLKVLIGMQLAKILGESSDSDEESCITSVPTCGHDDSAGRSCSPVDRRAVDRRARKQKKKGKARTEEDPCSSTATSSLTARPESPPLSTSKRSSSAKSAKGSKE